VFRGYFDLETIGDAGDTNLHTRVFVDRSVEARVGMGFEGL